MMFVQVVISMTCYATELKFPSFFSSTRAKGATLEGTPGLHVTVFLIILYSCVSSIKTEWPCILLPISRKLEFVLKNVFILTLYPDVIIFQYKNIINIFNTDCKSYQ